MRSKEKNKLSHFPTGLQENWAYHSFQPVPAVTLLSLQLHLLVSLLLGYYIAFSIASFLLFFPLFPASAPVFSAFLLSSCFFFYPIHHPSQVLLSSPVLLPVLTSVTHSAPATFQLLFAICLSWTVWAEVSAVDRAGCSISVSACLCNRRRRLSGPLSADQHRCR